LELIASTSQQEGRHQTPMRLAAGLPDSLRNFGAIAMSLVLQMHLIHGGWMMSKSFPSDRHRQSGNEKPEKGEQKLVNVVSRPSHHC
jgi:hypothetical protein